MKIFTAASTAAVVTMACLDSATAYSKYLLEIPNGGLFDMPLGHVSKTNDNLNAFGKAFKSAGSKWTATFCKANFPGTTIQNGAAFGDPCCKWVKGGTPNFAITAWTTLPTVATVCATTTTAPPATTATAPPAATTTAPPVATTTAPPVATTTAPPVATTMAPPCTVTARPDATTTAPPVVVSTTPSATTTRAPPVTTKPPAATTKAPPAKTTVRPKTTTPLPTQKQTKPSPTKRLRHCESYEKNNAVDEDSDSE